MRQDQRSTFARRMIRAGAKACVAVAALVGAANWAAKGYPDRAPASPGAMAARVVDDPVTTGSIAPRPDQPAGPRVVGPAGAVLAAKPGPDRAAEKIVARVPDFDQRALALLAAGAKADTTPAAKPAAPARKREAAAR